LSRDDHRRRHGFIACDCAAGRVPLPGGPRARRSADGQPRFGCNLSRINWQTCVAHPSSDHKAVVLEVLGHTRVTTTERYTHVATLQMEDASGQMGEALWGQG
jgi:hypothetical protein